MPNDWALTKDGHETTDPSEAMNGFLLGIGKYKGYGLSFMTDVLTGVISGGGYGLMPYTKNKISFVPQLFEKVLLLPFGIQSTKLHLHPWKEEDFYNYNNDLLNYKNNDMIHYNREQSNIDLLFRSGGEKRISGFFPTKTLYSELFEAITFPATFA